MTKPSISLMKIPSPRFAAYKLAQQIYQTGDMPMDYKTSRILGESVPKARAAIVRYTNDNWLAMRGEMVSISPACRKYFDGLYEVQKPAGEIVQPRTVDVYASKPWVCNLRREGVREIYFMAGAR